MKKKKYIIPQTCCKVDNFELYLSSSSRPDPINPYGIYEKSNGDKAGAFMSLDDDYGFAKNRGNFYEGYDE